MESKEHVPSVVDLAPVRIDLGGVVYNLFPKRFKSGSIGWFCSTKGTVQERYCQFSLCITVIGSKGTPIPEQKATTAETDPDASLFDRTFGNGSEPVKPRRKRS